MGGLVPKCVRLSVVAEAEGLKVAGGAVGVVVVVADYAREFDDLCSVEKKSLERGSCRGFYTHWVANVRPWGL